jgi:hypothetical protein
LLPFLRGIRRFAEPCCGDGALVRHIESFGLRCVYQGDIATGQDALERDSYGDAQVIITNPPYTRKVMHRLIAHFTRIMPTWLLLESDWALTKQALPYMASCTDIVSVRRIRWFEGTKGNSKDNFGWYRFAAGHTAGPLLHCGDQIVMSKACAQCGRAYQPERSTARFCSAACKQAAWRRRVSVTQP